MKYKSGVHEYGSIVEKTTLKKVQKPMFQDRLMKDIEGQYRK